MATHTFNAAEWFATWCDHGGIAVLIGDAVWIGRTAALDMEATQRLNQLREPITQPEAQSALARLLRANAALAEQMMEG
jgi:hypothetical protein